MAALALGAAAGMPATALAATKTTYVAAPVIPKVQPTVDHPPVDGVLSFDNGARDSGMVALTFDADMTTGMLAQLQAGQVRSWYNAEVRDILDQEHVPATIFMTGLWAQTYPDVARSLAQDPLFEIGNHTLDHLAFRTPCYGLAGAFDRATEIDRAQDLIQAASGTRPRLIRFPGDCYDRSDTAMAQQRGLLVISGDVRSGDAFNLSAVSVVNTVLRSARAGSIVVMHIHGGANAPMTAPALRTIIAALRGQGLSFGSVSQVLASSLPPPPPPVGAAAKLTSVHGQWTGIDYGAAPAAVKLAHLDPVSLGPPLHRRLIGKSALIA